MDEEVLEVYECLGGPLDGTPMERHGGIRRFWCKDDKKTKHYYRLLRVLKGEQAAVYWHYFGTSRKAANKAKPFLRPAKEWYKPIR